MYQAGQREAQAAAKAIRSMDYFRYGDGHEVHSAESEWSEMIGCHETVLLTSGTAALLVALKALGIGPGDSVLVPTYTYVATPLAVTAVGAIPIYVDVDETLTMDAADLARKISSHTKAVIPVHMVGMPCHMDAIKRAVRGRGIAIIEDCCQAAGGSFHGQRLGSIGDFGAFSFNEYKIISCGEGGACTVNKKRFCKRARSASDGGLYAWNEGRSLGNQTFCSAHYRFNNINAAILRQQIKRLEQILRSLRRTRGALLQQLQLPERCTFIRSHDEQGNCAVCLLIRASSARRAQAITAVCHKHMSAYRPIDSARHVYKDWAVINKKRGGHHPDWDCFRHPRNRRIKTNYDQRMQQSDRHLSQTVLLRVPFGLSQVELNKRIKALNKQLQYL